MIEELLVFQVAFLAVCHYGIFLSSEILEIAEFEGHIQQKGMRILYFPEQISFIHKLYYLV